MLKFNLHTFINNTVITTLSIFILLIYIPNNAQALNNSCSNPIYNTVEIEHNLSIEEQLNESEDNIIQLYILNNCRAKIIKQNFSIIIHNVNIPPYDIIIPPPQK